MTKLFIAMIYSRDNIPPSDKPIINMLGDLHTNLVSSLDCFIITIQHEQYTDIDDDNLVVVHEVMLEILWLPI